ncbi:MAG: BREX-1 system adenine-specific DNA-methyltransferase PglX [Chloroflexales bacterium]
MLKRHKDLLRPLVAALRAALAGATAADGSWQRGDLDRELERLGIAQDGVALPRDVVRDPAELPAREAAAASIEAAVNGSKGTEAEQKRRAAREEFVERAAYTWINRLLALRTLEARGLIDETLRANPDYDELSEALYALRQEQPQRAGGADGGWWAVIADACAAQAVALPGLFDPRDPSAALRPSTPALLRCVALVGTAPSGFALDEADAAFADPDAIGWAYQFYQEAAKARVYAKLGAGGKAATRAEIAAATQLFTEPYMVQWLLQNSLGRSYHEAYPDSKLPETWAYYIRNRPEGQAAPEHPRPLEALDLIDPCCGSGHFLREAFDMFAAMYREQHPELSAVQIADRIFERHIHGIDLDPRAAQLAALTLYLRACDLVKEEARRQRRPLSAIGYRLSAINIATTPSGLSAGALQRHLRRHPEDRVMKPLLEGVFAALERADVLGSLLRPAEHIDAAITALQGTHQVAMDFDADDATLRRTITALAKSDPAELKRLLLDRVATSFAAEAGDSDVAARLFGREAAGGVRLLQLLDRRYALVVTNPPYMGSANMDALLKSYVEKHFKAGKRDLYAAFILRCLNLCRSQGRVAMITQQSWMFLRSFAELRGGEVGLLQTSTVESLAHLGAAAFEEISGEVVQSVMFVLGNTRPQADHRITALRLVGLRSPAEKARLLCDVIIPHPAVSTPKQSDFMAIPESPLVYWIPPRVSEVLVSFKHISDVADVRQGIGCADVLRFVRQINEIQIGQLHQGWVPYVRGGGCCKWYGLEKTAIDWANQGARVKLSRSIVPSEQRYFSTGLTYTDIAGGALSVRSMLNDTIFSDGGPGIFVLEEKHYWNVAAVLNCRLISYILRVTSPSALHFRMGYVANLPLPKNSPRSLHDIAAICLTLKRQLVAADPTERSFAGVPAAIAPGEAIAAVLHTLEGINEREVFAAYGVAGEDMRAVLDETGVPAGFHPLVAGYDALPSLPASPDRPASEDAAFVDVAEAFTPTESYLEFQDRIAPTAADLRRIKDRLRALYEAGPGVKESEEAAEAEGDDEGDEAAASGAHIPIPTETFLEELSVKMQLHPISVYWLLEELRGEGARCKPEERRLLEDRLSVLTLRLLGHRWPRQIEAGEPVPDWADEDGIIPLTPGAGQPTLAERLRQRLRAEDGATGAQRAEALLVELTGQSLEEWLRREFFKRHTRQFKYRPITWHLASDPSAAGGKGRGKGKGRSAPAFECLLYYHACAGDAMARIRTQYVEPLLRDERQRMAAARRANQETEAAQAQARIQELEDFNRRLAEIAEAGFDSPELAKLLADEPLDRWDGDGYTPPLYQEDLRRQEQAWRVDLNDGVRVNIAPVQLAGLLAGDVLKAADAKKAIADRARWRSDERRWVRAGKLPRCGWMDEAAPENSAWTKLAPQRAAERAKLEAKRKAALGEG